LILTIVPISYAIAVYEQLERKALMRLDEKTGD